MLIPSAGSSIGHSGDNPIFYCVSVCVWEWIIHWCVCVCDWARQHAMSEAKLEASEAVGWIMMRRREQWKGREGDGRGREEEEEEKGKNKGMRCDEGWARDALLCVHTLYFYFNHSGGELVCLQVSLALTHVLDIMTQMQQMHCWFKVCSVVASWLLQTTPCIKWHVLRYHGSSFGLSKVPGDLFNCYWRCINKIEQHWVELCHWTRSSVDFSIADNIGKYE